MLLDSREQPARLFVYAVAASSILMTWGYSPVPAFRFSRPRDVGVTAYLVLVSAWFWLLLPAPILAPVFFADPAGAIVGKACSHFLGAANPRWFQNKTVAGSAAVLLFTFASISYQCSTAERVMISVAAALAEAVGGEYDNLCLAAVVLVAWEVTRA